MCDNEGASNNEQRDKPPSDEDKSDISMKLLIDIKSHEKTDIKDGKLSVLAWSLADVPLHSLQRSVERIRKAEQQSMSNGSSERKLKGPEKVPNENPLNDSNEDTSKLTKGSELHSSLIKVSVENPGLEISAIDNSVNSSFSNCDLITHVENSNGQQKVPEIKSPSAKSSMEVPDLEMSTIDNSVKNGTSALDLTSHGENSSVRQKELEIKSSPFNYSTEQPDLEISATDNIARNNSSEVFDEHKYRGLLSPPVESSNSVNSSTECERPINRKVSDVERNVASNGYTVTEDPKLPPRTVFRRFPVVAAFPEECYYCKESIPRREPYLSSIQHHSCTSPFLRLNLFSRSDPKKVHDRAVKAIDEILLRISNDPTLPTERALEEMRNICEEENPEKINLHGESNTESKNGKLTVEYAMRNLRAKIESENSNRHGVAKTENGNLQGESESENRNLHGEYLFEMINLLAESENGESENGNLNGESENRNIHREQEPEESEHLQREQESDSYVPENCDASIVRMFEQFYSKKSGLLSRLMKQLCKVRVLMYEANEYKIHTPYVHTRLMGIDYDACSYCQISLEKWRKLKRNLDITYNNINRLIQGTRNIREHCDERSTVRHFDDFLTALLQTIVDIGSMMRDMKGIIKDISTCQTFNCLHFEDFDYFCYLDFVRPHCESLLHKLEDAYGRFKAFEMKNGIA